MFSGHKNHAVCVVGYLQKIPENHAHLGIYPPPPPSSDWASTKKTPQKEK